MHTVSGVAANFFLRKWGHFLKDFSRRKQFSKWVIGKRGLGVVAAEGRCDGTKHRSVHKKIDTASRRHFFIEVMRIKHVAIFDAQLSQRQSAVRRQRQNFAVKHQFHGSRFGRRLHTFQQISNRRILALNK